MFAPPARVFACLIAVPLAMLVIVSSGPSHAQPAPFEDDRPIAQGAHLESPRLPIVPPAVPFGPPSAALPADGLPGPDGLPIDARAVNEWIDATVSGEPGQDDPFAKIDACVAAEMQEYGTPGASIAVAKDGQIVYTKGYGVRHPADGGTIDAETQFRIGSETKMMTAAAVLQLAEAGKVDLHEKLTWYLPDLQLAPPWELSDITMHQLLSHSSGIPDTYLVGIPQLAMPLEQWATLLEYLPLNATPGSFWNYANPNFSLAGLVVERLGGQPYNDYMSERVWAPANMTHTTMRASDVLAGGNYATGYTPGADTVHPPAEFDLPAIAPAGAAFSTPSDMVRWAQLMMDGGGAVLSPTSVAAMMGKQVYMDYTPSQYYGYGVFLHQFADVADAQARVPVFEHGGNVYGYSAQLYWVPERRMAVSVLANTMQSLTGSALCAVREVAGLGPVDDRQPPAAPETLPTFRGVYPMMNTALWTFTAAVEPVTDTLAVSYLDLGSRFALQPAFGDTFFVETGNPALPSLDFTFIRDRQDRGKVRWMRSRVLVGQRVGQFPATIPLTGDGCAPLPFTADMDIANLDTMAFGLSAPTAVDDLPIAQDVAADPSSASFKRDIPVDRGADMFFVILSNQPDDALGLYLLLDANADGRFAFPNEVVAAGQPSSATQTLLLLTGRQPAGRYQLWVHGRQVVGADSTFGLYTDIVAGDNLIVRDAPAAATEGTSHELRVCGVDTADLTGSRRGLVDFEYGYPPRQVRIPVTWSPAPKPPPIYLPFASQGWRLGP